MKSSNCFGIPQRRHVHLSKKFWGFIESYHGVWKQALGSVRWFCEARHTCIEKQCFYQHKLSAIRYQLQICYQTIVSKCRHPVLKGIGNRIFTIKEITKVYIFIQILPHKVNVSVALANIFKSIFMYETAASFRFHRDESLTIWTTLIQIMVSCWTGGRPLFEWMLAYFNDAHKPHLASMSWWRHQMEAFSALLALAGDSPVTGEFPSQRPKTQSFDIFFDLRLE